jgi:hypothetical protein
MEFLILASLAQDPGQDEALAKVPYPCPIAFAHPSLAPSLDLSPESFQYPFSPSLNPSSDTSLLPYLDTPPIPLILYLQPYLGPSRK